MIRNDKKNQVIIRSLQHLFEHCEVKEFSVYNHPVMTVLTNILGEPNNHKSYFKAGRMFC